MTTLFDLTLDLSMAIILVSPASVGGVVQICMYVCVWGGGGGDGCFM